MLSLGPRENVKRLEMSDPARTSSAYIWCVRACAGLGLFLSVQSYTVCSLQQCDSQCSGCSVRSSSTIGPVLFLLYAVDAILLVEGSRLTVHAYADDLQTIYLHEVSFSACVFSTGSAHLAFSYHRSQQHRVCCICC